MARLIPNAANMPKPNTHAAIAGTNPTNISGWPQYRPSSCDLTEELSELSLPPKINGLKPIFTNAIQADEAKLKFGDGGASHPNPVGALSIFDA